jgi:hypothetical protein
MKLHIDAMVSYPIFEHVTSTEFLQPVLFARIHVHGIDGAKALGIEPPLLAGKHIGNRWPLDVVPPPRQAAFGRDADDRVDIRDRLWARIYDLDNGSRITQGELARRLGRDHLYSVHDDDHLPGIECGRL